MQMSYWRFAAMIATSTVVMFGLMYLNTYAFFEHVYWSETRAWMALLMGATMAIIMLGFMLGMYKKRHVNIAIFAGAAAVFALTLWLVRSQATVNDVDYMRAMIPHHSIAVLTSDRAQIDDPRVRKLADEIIAAQRREIAEMKYLVEDIASSGEVDAIAEPQVAPRMVSSAVAIRTANIAEVDLSELDGADIERILGGRPRCAFHYSKTAGPVVAASATAPGGTGTGLIKLHGRLVRLDARTAAQGQRGQARLELLAPGITVGVDPEGEGGQPTQPDAGAWREATAILQLDAGLEVGYAGYYRCLGTKRTQAD